MCVIMVANRNRPNDEMVTRAFEHNRDGAGLAWRETIREGGNPVGEVVWKKGINDVEEIKALCRNTPLPYVVHFRIASVGGVRRSLTHPFLISPDANLALEGRTRGTVLFHNGHWQPWAEKALEAAINANHQIPVGEWSDTRAMAWMVNIYGPGFMEFLPQQKGVIFGPQRLNVFTGNGWDKVNDVWCSNDYFWHRKGSVTQYKGRICTIGRCTNPAATGRDWCDSCEKELGGATGKDDEAHPASDKKALPILLGGVIDRPLLDSLSLAQAEQLFKEKKISKGAIKKFRKEWGHIGTGGSRELRAKASLTKLSEKVAQQLLNGRVH